MGRLTQIIAYMTAEEAPKAEELRHFYTHMEPDDELKKLRRTYRLWLAKQPKDDQITIWDL